MLHAPAPARHDAIALQAGVLGSVLGVALYKAIALSALATGSLIVIGLWLLACALLAAWALDYPGVGPEHAFLADTGRARYLGITDEEALQAFHLLAHTEGILPALESSHALAQAIKLARERPRDQIVLCNLSGRGDKDVHTIAAREGLVL